MALLGFFPTTLYRGAGRDSIPRQSVELNLSDALPTELYLRGNKLHS